VRISARRVDAWTAFQARAAHRPSIARSGHRGGAMRQSGRQRRGSEL